MLLGDAKDKSAGTEPYTQHKTEATDDEAGVGL